MHPPSIHSDLCVQIGRTVAWTRRDGSLPLSCAMSECSLCSVIFGSPRMDSRPGGCSTRWFASLWLRVASFLPVEAGAPPSYERALCCLTLAVWRARLAGVRRTTWCAAWPSLRTRASWPSARATTSCLCTSSAASGARRRASATSSTSRAPSRACAGRTSRRTRWCLAWRRAR